MEMEKCSLCDGKGILNCEIKETGDKESYSDFTACLKVCPKCLGHKTVDWVENVVGVRKWRDPKVYVKLVDDFEESYHKEYEIANWWESEKEIWIYLRSRISVKYNLDMSTPYTTAYRSNEIIVGRSMEFKWGSVK